MTDKRFIPIPFRSAVFSPQVLSLTPLHTNILGLTSTLTVHPNQMSCSVFSIVSAITIALTISLREAPLGDTGHANARPDRCCLISSTRYSTVSLCLDMCRSLQIFQTFSLFFSGKHQYYFCQRRLFLSATTFSAPI